MSVSIDKAQVLRTDAGTPGGDTHWVVTPKHQTARALCFRQIVGDPTRRCTNKAGLDTWHAGTGACSHHGGSVTEGMGMVTGKFSKLRGTLRKRVDEYLEKDRNSLLDMTEELAITRSIFDEFLEYYPDPQSEDYGIWFHRFQEVLGTLGTLVEKMSRIDTRNTLTAAQVLYIRATMVDIILKYLPDPEKRELMVRELAARLGGDQSVALKRAELPKMTI
jgi:hypothetical protein